MRSGLVTLLTDFGWSDGYVGAMKGVLLGRCPDARLVDITHGIDAGDVSGAAYVLRQAAPCFPPETVHLVVVDPGVGSERRAVAVRSGGHVFVAPDNGVLGGIVDARSQARTLDNRDLWRADPSPVFHGRDLFAPVAAHLAAGAPFESVGSAIPAETLVCVGWPVPERRGDELHGEVIYVDRFGNLVTNVPLDGSGVPGGVVRVADRELRLCRSYSDAGEGELLALRGSEGLLEIACNRGSAAGITRGGRGLVVSFRAQTAEPA